MREGVEFLVFAVQLRDLVGKLGGEKYTLAAVSMRNRLRTSPIGHDMGMAMGNTNSSRQSQNNNVLRDTILSISTPETIYPPARPPRAPPGGRRRGLRGDLRERAALRRRMACPLRANLDSARAEV